ncbi:MAG: hypothetical protein IPK82_26495 [Polyangiaceae bacterium]|nr:hypothetical protein [Polyangiaceae bacterium]
MRPFLHLAALVPVSLVAALSASGCAPSAASYCEKICYCTGCDESQKDSCIDAINDARKKAEDADCGGEFNAALSCASAEFSCTEDVPSYGECSAEGQALYECSGIAGPVGANACEVAVSIIYAKYESCGIAVDPTGSVGECPPEVGAQYGCIAACIDATTCGVLNGTDTNGQQAFGNCIGGC